MFKTLIILYALNFWVIEGRPNPGRSFQHWLASMVQAACSTSRRTTQHLASRPKIMIPATATAPEMPATRAFSRQRVAYNPAFLPTAPYSTSNDGRIFAGFPVYMTRKTQGWFWRWECPHPSDAAASPGPGAAP
jgi:hypothetical protein